MNRRNRTQAGPGALELIEEAVHLLRLSGWSVLGTYYLGSLPFALGFLYFWADMSRSSTARENCASSAFGVSLLFLWMKTWQAVFAGRLKGQLAGRPAQALTAGRFARIALIQSTLQPSGLFLVALSLPILIPFGWVYGCYQNVTALGAEDGASPKKVFNRALKQACLWPRSNHLILGILFLFGCVVALDLSLGLVNLPALLKRFFGVESAFTRAPRSVLNTTFLATVCSLTYLCLDPLLKAVYLLRCFYGESLHTGEDLKAELKPFMSGAGGAAVRSILLMFLASVSPLNAGAAPENPSYAVPVAPSGITPSELDRSIEQVLNQPKYDWRFPRLKTIEEGSEKGFFAAFMEGLVETIRGWARAIAKAIKAVMRWIADALDWLREKVFGRPTVAQERRSPDWIVFVQALVFVFLVLAACAAAILFYRAWKSRGARREVAGEAVAQVADLTDENVTASQLPEDDWLKLARELMGKGELRLALRALYFASLAHLAQREMIRVAKFKSNRDYEQELRRRARALPELQAAFAENVGIFDRVWYGLHEVTEGALQRFQYNLEKIKAC